MKLLASAALVAGFMSFGASAADAASTPKPLVQLSGRTYHFAACPGASAGTARCTIHVVSDANGNALSAGVAVPHGLFGCQTTVPAGCVSPAQLRSAYNITNNGSATTLVAIVDAYGYTYAAADLANFRSQFGLPTCTIGNGCLRIINEFGGTSLPPPPTNGVQAGWDVEQAADLDMISAMCPNCRIVLIQATTASFSDLATAENEAASLGAHVISNSYGGGELGSQSFEWAYNHPGVAVTASTGDSGYGVAFPASSPHVIAVGGTSLFMNGNSRQGEAAWAGAGSGCSTAYQAPYWQASTNANMSNNTLCTMRVVADVSADADPQTGVLFYMNVPGFYGAGFYRVGGTSVSNQIIAGIYGEKGGTVFYGRNPYQAPKSAFFDVATGTNAPPSGAACGGSYLCVSVPGYDGPTGLGTPNGDSAF